MTTSSHVPVLLEETVRALAVRPGGRYIDCTIGGGGHAEVILKRSSPGGQLLGIDADPEAIKVARGNLEAYKDSTLLVNGNFVDLQAICIKYDFFPVHGILFDLGLSSLQLNGNNRGFSFQHDAPLDMRFDSSRKVTAADIVNTTSEVALAQLIRTYGEEGYSRRIASRIVKERPIKSTLQLAHLIEKALGNKRGRIHPATKTFQALRIVVNCETENLELALKQAIDLLGFEGRLAVISYHSLEDRIVKRFMQREAKDCVCPSEIPVCICGHEVRLRLITRKVIIPSETEIKLNPRGRSAKLRVAEYLDEHNDCYGPTEMPSLWSENKAEGWRRPALLKKLRMVFSMS